MRRKLKSWVQEKLENPKFKKAFEEEYEKLSMGEQLARLRLQAGLTHENAEYDRYELKTLKKIVASCGGKLKIIFDYKEAA